MLDLQKDKLHNVLAKRFKECTKSSDRVTEKVCTNFCEHIKNQSPHTMPGLELAGSHMYPAVPDKRTNFLSKDLKKKSNMAQLFLL